MKRFQLRKGLDVPIEGAPRAEIEAAPQVGTVGILGDDYIGLKPRILVAEGDTVAPGTPVMIHKDQPEVQIVSPVAGQVKAINRGERRKLISVEIEVQDGAAAPVDFSNVGDHEHRRKVWWSVYVPRACGPRSAHVPTPKFLRTGHTPGGDLCHCNGQRTARR